MHNMASLHIQPGRPHWFCAFTDPSGKRHFKSTGTKNKSHAKKICSGWVKASELTAQTNLTPDRARKLIEATVSDVLETHSNGTLTQVTLKNFFEAAAEVVMQPNYAKENLNKLVSETVRNLASASGETVPNASIRDWCSRWLKSKEMEAAPRTHERYEVSVRRFLKFLGVKADKDLTALRPDDLIRFRDNTVKTLSTLLRSMVQSLAFCRDSAFVWVASQALHHKCYTLYIQKLKKFCFKAGEMWVIERKRFVSHVVQVSSPVPLFSRPHV